MRCGIWSASQRAAYINRWAYQAHHLFLGGDPDDDAQKRLSEIGAAVDKKLVRQVVAELRQFEWLYVHRDSRTMCIIEP
jgi:flagellar motor switch protein FliM